MGGGGWDSIARPKLGGEGGLRHLTELHAQSPIDFWLNIGQSALNFDPVCSL
jgi:hypothetical protein